MHIYVKFIKQVYGCSIKRLIPGCHLEVCRGSEVQNINYIKKSGQFKEIGDAPPAISRMNERNEYYLQLIQDCNDLSEKEFITESLLQFILINIRKFWM